MSWVIYAFIGMFLVTLCDLLRKHLAMKNCDMICLTLLPLIIAGFSSLIYLFINRQVINYQNVLKEYNYIYIIIISFGIIFTHYCVNCSLNIASNPGYAKGLVSINILLTTIISTYLFKGVTLDKYCIIAILMILTGIIILISNKK
jgi:drug/metabolite transporter (DMT)-like permease